MSKELFILNDETFLVEINKTWISTIKEFKKLIVRDKGSEGDADGRKKYKAIKELTFVYHYVDFRSQFRDYPDVDKMKVCLRNAGFEEDYAWSKDEDLVAAIKIYEGICMTTGLHIVKAAKRAIVSLADFWNLIGNVGVKTAAEAKEVVASVTPIAKMLDSLDSLEERMKKELTNEVGLRGDSTKGFDEDEDSNY